MISMMMISMMIIIMKMLQSSSKGVVRQRFLAPKGRKAGAGRDNDGRTGAATNSWWCVLLVRENNV
jgi:hypothetical protein